jgi:hypothetical protein
VVVEYGRRPRRIQRGVVLTIIGGLLLLACAALGLASIAAATAHSSDSSADLFVTSPPGAISVVPGKVATATLTVGNLGRTTLDVEITSERVVLLDNGGTRFAGAGSDPLFAGRIHIPQKFLSLPPRQERNVIISTEVPKGLKPNDYFLGFLVSPVINSASVTVQNDIGALVVLDVPGPRHIKIVASFHGLPAFDFSLSSSASGFVRADNDGTSTVQFTTTTETGGWPSPRDANLEIPARLLPPGLFREFPVHVSSWLGLGWYTIRTTFVYDKTQHSTGEVTISKTVVILNPLWLIVIPAAGFLVLFRIRRKHHRRSARPRAARTHSALQQMNKAPGDHPATQSSDEILAERRRQGRHGKHSAPSRRTKTRV